MKFYYNRYTDILHSDRHEEGCNVDDARKHRHILTLNFKKAAGLVMRKVKPAKPCRRCIGP